MKARLIAGRAGCGKTRYCLEAVGERLRASVSGEPRLFLFVPEQSTLQMERALLEDAPYRTLGRASVLSFQRLQRRILAESRTPVPRILDPVGRQMVLRRLIGARRERLHAFGSIADRPGFLAKLSASLSELMREAVRPEDLRRVASEFAERDDPSAATLLDTADIYQAYVAHLGDRSADPDGVLELVRERLAEAEWLRGALVWMDGFAGFSARQLQLVVTLAQCVEQLEITMLLDPAALSAAGERPPDPLSIFARTDQTWAELARALTESGVEILPPRLLQPRVPPRFRSSELAELEQRLFHASPCELAAGVPFGPSDVVVRIVQAPDPRVEVEAAAREVRRLTVTSSEPMRFRDVAIICRDLEPYGDLLSAALTANEIPFFIDQRRSTAHHPLVELVRSAILMHEPERFAEAVVLILKTGLTPLTDDQADELENHLLARGIRFAWEWSDIERWGPPSPTRERDAIINAMGAWWPSQTGQPTRVCREWIDELFALLERLGAPARLQQWAEAASQRGAPGEADEHERLWNDLVSLIEQVADALGDDPLRAWELLDVLNAGLAEFTLGLVPPTLDQVLVGTIDRSRQPPIKAMFLLGFSDGLFPRRPVEDSVLGDYEREQLCKSGVRLEPKLQSLVRDERLFAYIAATRAGERLWISYPAADLNGRPQSPSPYLAHVRWALPHVPIERYDHPSPETAIETASTPSELAGAIAAALRQSAMKDGALSSNVVAAYEAARSQAGLTPYLARVLGGLAANREVALSAADAAALFPDPLESSVSKLESFAWCPFRHFAQHGLRLRLRPIHELSDANLGELYHKMLEHFVGECIAGGRTLCDLSVDDVERRLERIGRDILPGFAEKLGLDEPRADAARRQADRELTAVLDAHRTWPKHTPSRVELSFGDHAAASSCEAGGTTTAVVSLPPLVLQTPKGRSLHLRGKIDRVDLVRTKAGRLGIVYDYKRSTGRRLSLDEVYHGLSLQLITYLLVLQEHGDELDVGPIRPAAALYSPLLGGFKPVPHPQEANKEGFNPHQAFKPRGVIDFGQIDHLDPEGSRGQSRTFNIFRLVDGGAGRIDNSDSLEPGSFGALLEHVRTKLTVLADRCLDGDVEVRPRRHGDALPCGRCDFQSVCRFEVGLHPAEKLKAMKRSEVIAQLGELGDRGR